MLNLTRQEQLIALILIGGIIIGGVVLWIRREPAPPIPEPLEFEFDLSEVERDPPNHSANTLDGTELIDLNTANSDELQRVPGIGPKTAELIIERRETEGPFKDLDELTEIYGIGEKKLDIFREYLTIAGEDDRN